MSDMPMAGEVRKLAQAFNDMAGRLESADEERRRLLADLGHELRTLNEHLRGAEARVAAIYRKGRAIQPEGHTVIEPDDEVFFLAARADIRKVVTAFRRSEKPYRRVIIAGGGNIGLRLAESIEHRYQVKLIDSNPETTRRLSERLDKSIVLLGDGTKLGNERRLLFLQSGNGIEQF